MGLKGRVASGNCLKSLVADTRQRFEVRIWLDRSPKDLRLFAPLRVLIVNVHFKDFIS